MSLAPVRTALLSTYDKTGVVALARTLTAAGVRLISSGGTAELLRASGLDVTPVSSITEFPEMLDGRVKTLHPKIHAGILADRSKSEHLETLRRHGIAPIDLVVVNLYPFERAAADPDAAPEAVVEMIDIGGPTLIRAAAKNHAHVGVVVDPADYEAVAEAIREQGGLDEGLRRRLAAKAFGHTSRYDAAIHAYLDRAAEDAVTPSLPELLSTAWPRRQTLRYGENPHQQAAFYADPAGRAPSVARAEQLQGKELSFNNILDLDAALGIVVDFEDPACAIIKHGNPCGAALGAGPEDAFQRALQCDPVSAFGGVIAFNRPVDGATADAVAEAFYEAVIAPGFEPAARERLARKKKLRLLAAGDLRGASREGLDLRRVQGGLLAQQWDAVSPAEILEGRVVTQRRPSEDERRALVFAWIIARHVRSNAIVYAKGTRTVGIGAGQMSRVDAARFGILKAREDLQGAVMASDAFFPFRDGVDVAAEAGVKAVAQPGGSIRDDEVIQAADEHGLAMIFTGRRHFRH